MVPVTRGSMILCDYPAWIQAIAEIKQSFCQNTRLSLLKRNLNSSIWCKQPDGSPCITLYHRASATNSNSSEIVNCLSCAMALAAPAPSTVHRRTGWCRISPARGRGRGTWKSSQGTAEIDKWSRNKKNYLILDWRPFDSKSFTKSPMIYWPKWTHLHHFSIKEPVGKGPPSIEAEPHGDHELQVAIREL